MPDELNTYHCDSCGEFFEEEDMHFSECGDHCYACHRDRDDSTVSFDSYLDDPVVLNYDAKPLGWRPESKHGDRVFVGMELELRFSDYHDESTILEAAKVLGPSFFWKSDGSLNGPGAELVLKPFSLKSFPKKALEEAVGRMRTLGATSYETGDCGLHVHVSREGLTRRQIRRIQAFMLANRCWLEPFSKRDGENAYCRWPTGLHCSRWCDRYVVFNTRPADTVEFRLWRGTTAFNRIWASVQLSHAMVQFAKQHSFACCSSPFGLLAFTHFIKTNPFYSGLDAFLRSSCYDYAKRAGDLHEIKPYEKDFHEIKNLAVITLNWK